MLKMILIIVSLIALSLFLPIWLNAVSLFDDPGFSQRLKTYLSLNTVKTEKGHPFPELRPSHFDVTVEEMFQILDESGAELGWEFAKKEAEQAKIAFVVTSSLWQFKDDLVVQARAHEGGTELDIQSKSRVGRGDFGANLGHVLKLLSVVKKKVAANTR